jgi:Toprim domain
MGYMKFEQQVALHLQFLQQAGLEVDKLAIDSGDFIRSRRKGEEGRGEYAYKTVTRQLNNGLLGLMTWCRSVDGTVTTYKTYGTPVSDKTTPNNQEMDKKPIHGCDESRIKQFWEHSSSVGESDYLKRKCVKGYRIRFRENQYGKVAVIPLRDIDGELRGYQILNADGSKVFAKGIKLKGLFHQLTDLKDNVPIGIAEGYVTAATCYERIPMPMVAAFTGDNMEHVAEALRRRYPNSPLVIFADNDKHLARNKGMLSAEKALRKANGNGIILEPMFCNTPEHQVYSDWNDLVREIGEAKVFKQLWKQIEQKTSDERIKTFYF